MYIQVGQIFFFWLACGIFVPHFLLFFCSVHVCVLPTESENLETSAGCVK